jgi:hypothetical protein
VTTAQHGTLFNFLYGLYDSDTGSWLSKNISPVCTILYNINRGLNACNTVFRYKLILPQLLNTFSFFYWTVLTTAICRSLSPGRRIKSTPSHPISFRSISTLPSLQHLCFPHGLSTSEFPTIILYEFFISPLCTTYHTHHILLDFIDKISGKEMPTNLNLLGVGLYAVSSASCHLPSL